MDTDIITKLEEKIEEALSGKERAEGLDRDAVDAVAGGSGSSSENKIIDDDPIVLPEI